MSRHEGDTAPVQARPDGQFLQTSLELRVRYPSGRSQTYPIQRTPLRLGLDVPLEAGPQLELRLQAGRVVFQSLQADELVTHLGQSVQQGDWPVATSLEFCGHRILLWDRQRPATFLQCYTPPYAGELWPLEPGCYHLGRPGKRHNEIELDHPTVSREHATLRLGPQGLELTADYGNPVFVDGSQLPAGAGVELKHGDFIEIGEVLFKLHQRAEPAAGALLVRSLGVFGVEVEGRPILEWGSRNARWLLARLAHAWGQPVATESLVDLLWPEMAPEKARNNLGFTLSLLRKILREHSPQTAIFRSSTSLELNSGFLKQHDYTELQSCLQRGQQARRESQVESMEKFFQQALALYQGAYLEDCYLDWASQVRLECEARVLEAGLELQRFYSAQGRQDELAAASHRQLGIDPCCQQSTLHLLRFHLNRGDSASMRRYFELYKAALARHLDSPPGPEVCELLALAPAMSSEPVEELLKLLESQAGPEAVQRCLEQRRQALEGIWDEVCLLREQLGEDFQQAHPVLLADLEKACQTYAGALDQVLPGRPAPALRPASHDLLRALQLFHQARLHWGPSPFPLVNLLRNLEPGHPLLQTSEEYFRQALQELEAADLAGQPGWGLKKAALDSVCQALAALRDGAPPDQQIELVEAAMHSMHRADETVYQGTFLQGPTALPMVNLVINVARRVLDGQLSPSELNQALEAACQSFESLEQDFKEAPGDSPLLQAEVPKTRLAFDLLHNALEDLSCQLESWDGAEVISCLSRLQAATHRLHGCYRVFAEFEQAGDQAACPRCGHLNAISARVCLACQAQLPRVAVQFVPQGFLLEESGEQEAAAVYAVRLLESCGEFYDGHISAEEFRQSIGQARTALESSLEHLAQLRVLDGEEARAAQAFLDEERPQLEQDLQDWGHGLDLLEQHSYDLDFDSLEHGIALVWQSSQSVRRRFQAIQTETEDLAPLS